MKTYNDISNEAHTLLKEIANNENNAPALTVLQVEELGDRAGIHADKIFAVARDLEKAGIVKIDLAGKNMHLDKFHIDEFRRKFPAQ